MLHPSKNITGSKGSDLKNRKIILGITGSVAAYKAVDIARELMRYGADVIGVMSEAATSIIHPNLIQWATGNPVITKLSGDIEHISLLSGYDRETDLLLIAPATANTINKIAGGLSDTVVTAVTSAALGSGTPIIIVPAMHDILYKNPITQVNIKKLVDMGIGFIGPRVEEEKAKIADLEEIIAKVVRRIGERDYEGKKVLVLAGPTIEYIDPVRVITNLSSGKMGLALAYNAFLRGADVKIIFGPGSMEPPHYLDSMYVKTTEQMYESVLNEVKSINYDIVVAAAAPVDLKPSKMIDYKIPTKSIGKMEVTLIPTPKIVDMVKSISPKTFLVIFKADYKVKNEELIKKAFDKLMEAEADLIVANDVGKESSGFRVDTNEVYVIDREKNIVHIPLMTKQEVSRRLLDIVKEKIYGK